MSRNNAQDLSEWLGKKVLVTPDRKDIFEEFIGVVKDIKGNALLVVVDSDDNHWDCFPKQCKEI